MEWQGPLSNEGDAGGAGRNRAYRCLLTDILNGELQPGARLVEQDLTRMLGLSRTPVREALFQLEREGFVYTELRRGFRVVPLTEAEARQIYPIIGALEALAIEEAGSLLKAAVPGLRQANRRLKASGTGREELVAADSEFHNVLVGGCPNLQLLDLLRTFHRRALRYEHLFMRERPLVERSAKQHQEIIDAIDSGKLAKAKQAIERNYRTGMESVIGKLRRIDGTRKNLRAA